MILSLPVSRIMTTNLITITCDDSLKEAEHLMKKNRIRHLPVTKDGQLAGIISLTDLQRISFAESFDGDEENADYIIYDLLSLDQVMIKNPVSVDKSSSIKKVGDVLLKNKFHALPVTENGKLVGIVTTTDLLKHLLA